MLGEPDHASSVNGLVKCELHVSSLFSELFSEWAQEVASLYCVALWWHKQERKQKWQERKTTTGKPDRTREKEERGMYPVHRARFDYFHV